jgi:pimeloyl-ACP methyl ester carboxylesterase
VPLYAEELPATGTPRGVMMLLAGGPGQASTSTFNLRRNAAYWRSYFPGYTLVTYDDRGTGKSGALNCDPASTLTECGNSLTTRAFYTTREHAEDIESVRNALGVDKLGVYGVSYGTKQAVAYALSHPDHVERLLLDSQVVTPDHDPLGTDSLRAIPGAVNSICFAACKTLTPDIGTKLAELANQLESRPLEGMVPTPNGAVGVFVNGDALLDLAFDSDLSNGISSQLPAAVDAALRGWALPLERLDYLERLVSRVNFSDLDIGLYLATDCGDGPFPWQPGDASGQREANLQAAIAALPPGTTGPFGTWALYNGLATTCLEWPSPSGGATLGAGPLPDVPVLILSGDRDIRTPTPGAVTMAARFPHAQVLVVPGSGHSVLPRSGCAWLDSGTPPSVCTRIRVGVPPLERFRKSVAETPPAPRVAAPAAKTVTALVQTVDDAEDAWLLARLTRTTVSGLVGGKMTPDPVKVLRLSSYSSVRGLAITGTVVLELDRLLGQPAFPLTVTGGTLTVTGAGAAHGVVKLVGNKLTGTLAGEPVSATF